MPSALVVGGGIGGLTCAVALQQRGWQVMVHEAAEALRPVGKGIWMPANAMQNLERLGVGEKVRHAGWPLRRIDLQDHRGPVLSSVNLQILEKHFGHTIHCVRRSGLVQILAESLLPGTLQTGSRFQSCRSQGERVTAYFESGSECSADLLIGADGIRSAVRGQLFPSVRYRYSGQTCFRGISRLALPPELVHVCREVWGGSLRFGYSSVSAEEVYWFAPIVRPELRSGSDGLTAESLSELFRSFPFPVSEIVSHTDPAEIIRTDLHDFLPIDSWHNGRVVLIGDAAHAMQPNLGQGGAQAVEDGYLLAELLNQKSSVEEALNRFEAIRMPRVRWIAGTAWRMGQIAHWQNRVACGLRNLIVRTTPNSMQERTLLRLGRPSTAE